MFHLTRTEKVKQNCTWSETMQQLPIEVQIVIHHLIQLMAVRSNENETRKLCYVWFSNQYWQKFHFFAHSASQAHLDVVYNRRNPRITSLKQQGGVKIWLQHSHAGLLTGKQVKWWEKDFLFAVLVFAAGLGNIMWLVSKQMIIWKKYYSQWIYKYPDRQREIHWWITKLLVHKAK